MSKLFLTGTFLHFSRFTLATCVGLAALAILATEQASTAQDASKDAAETNSASTKSADASKEAKVVYPIAVAVDGEDVYMVDLDLPGIWKISGDKREVFFRGSNLLRKTMNRPRPIALHPDGGLLVGDSATREVYHIQKDAEPKPLCKAYIGVAMSIAVAPDGKSFYVGDAEKRATFQVPIGGGDPKLIVRVNARGLAFDADGNLWAATPDADAVMKIDVEKKEAVAVIKERPYGFPNGLAWAGDHGYVVDVYSKAIWKFTADGKTEKLFEGEPLVSPNGIAYSAETVYVTDPRSFSIYKIDTKTQKLSPLSTWDAPEELKR